MPPKKVKTKNSSGDRDSNDENNFHANYLDAQYNPDVVESLLQDLQKQVDMKCQHIQSDADFMITSMQEAFHLELIKLPTQVKKMSMARFKQEFGDSLEAVTRGAIGGSMKTQPTQSKTNHGRPSMVFQTPLVSKHQNLVPQTPSARNPKEGEEILSTNGSPLGVFSTAVKAKQPTQSFVPPTPGIYIPLESGDVLDIEAVDVSSLPNELKNDAIMKMQAMMSNMQKLMSQLEGSK